MPEIKAAENNVYIEGILSEVDLKDGTFDRTNSNGVTEKVEYTSGKIKVKTEIELYGKPYELEIPVKIMVTKKTRKGVDNPAYASVERLRSEFVSLAAAEEPSQASLIKIGGANLAMNEYVNKQGKLSVYPEVRGSFFNHVKPEEYKPRANFDIKMVVGSMYYEEDDGVQTGRYIVKGIVPQFGNKVDVFTFYVIKPEAINGISQLWAEGDTVNCHGSLLFTSSTKTTVVESAFGDPVEKTTTINLSDLVITGGSDPFDDMQSYDSNVIAQCLAERTARQKKLLEDANKPSSKPTAASSKPSFASFGAQF